MIDTLDAIMGKFLEPLVKEHGERYRKIIASSLEFYYEHQDEMRPTSGAFNINAYIQDIIESVQP